MARRYRNVRQLLWTTDKRIAFWWELFRLKRMIREFFCFPNKEVEKSWEEIMDDVLEEHKEAWLKLKDR